MFKPLNLGDLDSFIKAASQTHPVLSNYIVPSRSKQSNNYHVITFILNTSINFLGAFSPELIIRSDYKKEYVKK